jgi:hypothetical protein
MKAANTMEISEAGVACVRIERFFFNSFSERRYGAELRASVLIGLRSVIIAYRFGHVASPYS